MTRTARDFLTGKAVTDDGRFPIREVYYDPTSWALRHAVVDVGGWFSTDEILVSVERFALPQDDGWPVSITRSELDAAPQLSDPKVNTIDLPALLVGPFGNTISPLMIAAMHQRKAEDIPDTPPDNLMRDGAGRVFHLEKISDWFGLSAFDSDGALGQVEDFVLSDTFVLTHAILDDGSKLALSRFRRFADQGHALFN